ncbi:MAG: ATP-grasp domain-containing protein [Spirochaetota bacterium]
MKRTILILGAGVMQLPAIRAARRLGLYVIVADGNREAVGIREADEFLPVDLKDHETMASAAEAIRERRGLHAAFTAGTDFSSTVAHVCDRLGLPGTTYEAALNATDKFRMRGVLRDAGVAVPDFALLDAEEIEAGRYDAVREAVALPVVVKPVDSMGARGVVRADSWAEAERFARDAVAFSRSGRVVVEGYIEGPEFSLDAIVYDDDVQITGVADRHIRFPPYFIEVGHTIPTGASADVRRRVEAEFVRAIRALGIGPGAAKGDVKYSSAGPVIGEIAARLSGGYMSGWTYPLSSGVPLSELAIRVALGEAPPRATPRLTRTSAERAIVSIPGVLRELRGVTEARAVPGLEELFVTRSPGDVMRFPRNNVEKAGNAIATAATREGASAAAERAVSLVEAVLEPGDERTDAFLFGDPGDRTPPENKHRAFDVEHPAAEDAMRGGMGVRRRPAATRASTRAQGERGRRPTVVVPESLAAYDGRDWSYRTIRESLDRLESTRACRVRFTPSPAQASDPLSRLVCSAIVKGGLQGARYALDTHGRS